MQGQDKSQLFLCMKPKGLCCTHNSTDAAMPDARWPFLGSNFSFPPGAARQAEDWVPWRVARLGISRGGGGDSRQGTSLPPRRPSAAARSSAAQVRVRKTRAEAAGFPVISWGFC